MNYNDFINVSDSEDFKILNHNPSDHENYRRKQAESNDKIDTIVKKMERQERKKLVDLWDKSIPARWSGGSLKNMEGEAARKARESVLNSRKPLNFYISGDHGSGKTFLSYAIMRLYISLGFLHPSEIKFVSEEKIISMAKSGFMGQNNLSDLMDYTYKAYIVDNVGARNDYDQKELPIWDQFIEHIYNNSLIVVFNGYGSAASFSEKFNGSTNSKIRYIINGNTLTMRGKKPPELNDWTDEELEEFRRLKKSHSNFDVFK